jgi:hypothetical protein
MSTFLTRSAVGLDTPFSLYSGITLLAVALHTP